ncbi:hypothetical protein [Luteimonas kalidii]|uniref:Uncharacterized protein n=1 Tax=Luteimonas kalidii TaxID=3042025 RepID=A0ABT6JNV2_9GAMM|nr:hypothetical protein [Luteimonas kalidii]MDH5832353.1 hypothetical protein [Luteimonas kalidii]
MPIGIRSRAWNGWLAGVLLAVAGIAGAAPREPLVLDGVTYEHRWSKDGQNEYTPPGHDDLARWEDMVTLIPRPQITDGEALAGLANGVLANYQGAGVILRTDSRPATPAQPAEHLMVAILGGGPMAEAAFARLLLHDGAGLIVVRSRRAYGETAALDIGAWLQAHGAAVEQSLMQWEPPSMAALQTLPQAP